MPSIVGDSIPPGDPHGVSVSLPTWEDNVGWSSRHPRVLNVMKTGYPRFFIPRIVDKLAQKLITLCHTREGDLHFAEDARRGDRLGLLVRTSVFSKLCKEFLIRKGVPVDQIRLYSLSINGVDAPDTKTNKIRTSMAQNPQVHVISYPAENFKLAKAFWQHTGFGISSRCAEYWLQIFDFSTAASTIGKHDLPFVEAEGCKRSVNNRLAELAASEKCAVSNQDVWLYPTGMSAIAHTALAIMAIHSGKRCNVAVFGFLYVDTFKVLTTVFDLAYTLYGHATPSEIDVLEASLSQGSRIDALYLEFPGNPLLSSPDLLRLRALSKQYDFLLIVDDTVGTFVNVSLLPHCDIICTSLTKMFSGGCNVMGGSIVLNQHASMHPLLSHHLTAQFEDTYFPLDAIIMDRNSRDFAPRVHRASANAELIADILSRHPTVTRIYYPKNSPTQHVYDRFKRPDAGYGFLLSIIFREPACAIAFYDNLDVAKGPSLGTNFTLSCAYTLLAHYYELEWAAEHGVVEYLVRISVGVEEPDVLKGVVLKALEAAGNAVSSVSVASVAGVNGTNSINGVQVVDGTHSVNGAHDVNGTNSVNKVNGEDHT